MNGPLASERYMKLAQMLAYANPDRFEVECSALRLVWPCSNGSLAFKLIAAFEALFKAHKLAYTTINKYEYHDPYHMGCNEDRECVTIKVSTGSIAATRGFGNEAPRESFQCANLKLTPGQARYKIAAVCYNGTMIKEYKYYFTDENEASNTQMVRLRQQI